MPIDLDTIWPFRRRYAFVEYKVTTWLSCENFLVFGFDDANLWPVGIWKVKFRMVKYHKRACITWWVVVCKATVTNMATTRNLECMCIYIHTHTKQYIYIYIYIHIHTHTHTHKREILLSHNLYISKYFHERNSSSSSNHHSW